MALAAREELAAAELAVRDAQIAALAAQVEELQHWLDKDSSTSSKPPSSDGPYRKPRDRSLRASTGRRPGKQPGAQSSTLRQSPDPGVVIDCPPPECRRCGTDLAGVPVLEVQKLQVHEAAPPSTGCSPSGALAAGTSRPGAAPHGSPGGRSTGRWCTPRQRWPSACTACRSAAPRR